MSQKRVKTVVIGAGGIANSVHLPSLREISACEVAALCDLIQDRARPTAERFSIPNTYVLYRDMLAKERPDAAFVLVQPDQAFRIALDCMEAGVPVFMEKPAGITLYQAETLARASKRLSVPCQVGFNRRFVPLLDGVLEALRPYGPLLQIDGWFYKNSDADFYGGCASAFECDTVHVIDLVRHLADGRADKVVSLASRHGGSPVDNAWNALIAFDNGVTGTIHANYATGGRVHGFALHARGASAYVSMGFGGEACEARVLTSDSPLFSLGAQGGASTQERHLEGKTGEYYQYYGYLSEDEAFIHAVSRGASVPCDIGDALETMRLTDRIAKSCI